MGMETQRPIANCITTSLEQDSYESTGGYMAEEWIQHENKQD